LLALINRGAEHLVLVASSGTAPKTVAADPYLAASLQPAFDHRSLIVPGSLTMEQLDAVS